jgi:prophage DNA circulation protein
MAWFDRLIEAAYTSPSGTRKTFYYEDVARSTAKKTAAFDFSDADGTYIQDRGRSGRQYPLSCIFWGEDCDTDATEFENLLTESGAGVLEHPVYGVVNVVPFGTISRNDAVVTAGNQSIVSVTFWDTISTIYPTGQNDPASSVTTSVSEYNDAASETFEDSLSLDSVVEETTFQNTYDQLLDTVSSTLADVAAVTEDVEDQFETIYNSIDQSMDTLIDDPLTLAFQTALLIQAPAKAAATISARLDAYSGVIDQIIDTLASDSNDFATKDLFASAAVTGAIVSVVNTTFSTKTAALSAAETILTMMDDLIEWRDNQIDLLTIIDTGGAYQQLQEAAAIAAGYLVDISFSLKQERSITLTRARTIIDLAAELYGDVDDYLDYIISTNNLSGSEILELPNGKEILYYV